MHVEVPSQASPSGRFLLFILLFLGGDEIQVWPCCKLAGFVFGFVFGLGLGLGFGSGLGLTFNHALEST